MAEETQRAQLYDYRSNSNLVLNLEKHERREILPSSEVESLTGKFDAKKLKELMGSRVTREKPKELEERLQRAKKRREEKTDDELIDKIKSKKSDDNEILSHEIDTLYKPRTKETKKAYEVLLDFINHELGSQPHDVLRSAADELLIIMKEDETSEKDRLDSITSLFRLNKPMSSHRFSQLVNITQKITDFSPDAEVNDNNEVTLDERLGVPVVFEEDEKEQQSDMDEVFDDDDDIEEDEQLDEELLESKIDEVGEMDQMDIDVDELDVKDIDKFWLQRKLRKYYPQDDVSQKMESEVYSILKNTSFDDRSCENNLVFLLEHDKFDFVKLLLRNRQKIIYCMKLAHATSEEKKKIEIEMENNPKLKYILDSLHRTRITAAEKSKDMERNLLKEARALKTAIKKEEKPKITERTHQTIDINAISFNQGGHFMSNTNCKVPDGSWRVEKKGYQEVHVPAMKAVDRKNIKMIYKNDLPSWTHPSFSSADSKENVEKLNPVQSTVYKSAFLSGQNLLICAPTGSGKTNVAMLTILREIGLHRNNDGTIRLDEFKIIYVAPMKSLVREVVMKFSQRLSCFNIRVEELSGDVQLTRQQIADTQIIVTTPEKWDIITRKSGDRSFTELVRLVIIDEIHLLHDDRGPVLESIVCRTVRSIEATSEMVRLVALSATLPNYEDVATFLRVKPEEGLFFFDNSFRPVPLQQQYIGVTEKKPFKRHQLMNEICFNKLVDQVGQNYQVLVFVHSRSDTANTARSLKDMAQEQGTLDKFIRDERSRIVLVEEAQNVKSEDLKEVLPYGFGIHHAGMTRNDRTLVEDLFWAGHIQVLCSTATLAWGVNLPAHTVIIKGTQVYSPEKGSWIELSPQDILQMIGRAGRPQFDTFGEGIIITQHSELYYYLSLLNQQLPIESQLMSRLVDSLNAEVVSGSVQNLQDAVHWLSYTYLYIRMLKSPSLYGINEAQYKDDPELEQRRIDLAHSASIMLDRANLVKYDRKVGQLQITDLGKIASHYYIAINSMITYNENLKPHMSDIEIFRVFSLSEEFKYMKVREEEKLEMAKLLDRVPIPIKENLEEASAKVNVLLQSYISRLPLEGYALQADMVFIQQSAGRILRALFMIALKRNWAGVAQKLLNICKMVDHRMWGSQSPLRQFRGIPMDIVKRIEKKDFPWERFYDLKPQEIGEFIRFPKLGKAVHKLVHQLPRMDLNGQIQPITRTTLRVELTITPDFIFDEKIHGFSEPFWIIIEDSNSSNILHHEYFVLKRHLIDEEHTVTFTLPITDPMPPQYFATIVSDRWLGSHSALPISFRNLLLPDKYPPCTELLDLQPMPVKSILKGDILDKIIQDYSKKFTYFNAIQTQAFSSLYESDENVFISCPPGSGKTICAELAIINTLRHNPSARCVYVAPFDQLANERYIDWKNKFDDLGVNVVLLTGDNSTDPKLLLQGQIVISNPIHWDIISRRWKTRKSIQNVNVFIIDEIHLINGVNGPNIEVITSRMRYIASQTDVPIRIIALGACISNGNDLSDWIGSSNKNSFCFHPNVRPVPLDIIIQTFDIYNYETRMQNMIRPSYQTIKSFNNKKPVIVFVPSRKYARHYGINFLSYVASSENPEEYLKLPQEDIEKIITPISQQSLKQCLKYGIGYLHEGLSSIEKQIVLNLFDSGAIQILISTSNMAYGMSSNCYMVLISGTQRYDGNEHRYVDYTIPDMIQMMGRACRANIDNISKCYIFCHSPQKYYYQKFLFEPFPVESHLIHQLSDHFNAEISTRTIENVQDAVDYLTWTFMYRRLTKNPNYYNLDGTSHHHLNDYLSELTEDTLTLLQDSRCISIEDDVELTPLNLGMIAAYYYIKHSTIELFDSSLKSSTKMNSLLQTLSNASEFDNVPVRLHEERALQQLAKHLRFAIEEANYSDPHTKTNILLQAYFSRIPLSADVGQDQNYILPIAVKLLKAIVDVISSNRWLSPALACMEMSQMVTQGLWENDNPILQIPGFTPGLVEATNQLNVNDVFDFMNLEPKDLEKILSLVPSNKKKSIENFCNNFPNIEVEYELESESVDVEDSVTLSVIVKRLDEEEEDISHMVVSDKFPVEKTENWWLVIGDVASNILYTIKSFNINKNEMKINLVFEAPSDAGFYKLALFLMCDSYIGCDQEYKFELNVKANNNMDVE